MTTLSLIVLASIAVMSVSFIGVLTIPRLFGDWLHRHLSLLVSFSAGLFTIVVLNLVLEANEVFPLWQTALWVLLGLAGMYALSKLLPESHHHHSDQECDDSHPAPHALRILIADAIHNIGDGIILVPAFMVDIRLGFGVLIGIVVHEAMQELSEFFVLRAAGYSTKKALVYNFLASSTILIGVMLSYAFLSLGNFESILLALSAGAFSFVVLKDLLPHSFAHAKQHGLMQHFAWSVAGVLVMVAIGALTPHEHVEEEDAHNDSVHEVSDHSLEEVR